MDKVMSLKEAVSANVHDGDSVAIGGFLARAPMGIVYEVIRQKKKELTVIADSNGEGVDFLIGAGLVKKVEGAWIWISTATAYNFRRALEKGIPNKIEMEDYSNLAIGMRYLAGSLGIPFMPIRSLLASDIPKYNPNVKIIDDPYTNERICLVPAANPDVAFIHIQRADKNGNGQIWGILGNDVNLARAAKRVILTCEEIVPTKELRKIPNMTAIPGYCVDAVVELPFGAYQQGVPGFFWIDTPQRRSWSAGSQTYEGFLSFLDEWVYGCNNHEELLRKVGSERLAKLRKMELDNSPIPQIIPG